MKLELNWIVMYDWIFILLGRGMEIGVKKINEGDLRNVGIYKLIIRNI